MIFLEIKNSFTESASSIVHFDKSTVNKLVKMQAISGDVFNDSVKKLYTVLREIQGKKDDKSILNTYLLPPCSSAFSMYDFPFTPEKIITVIIAIFLLKLIFPNDKKTLEKLHNMKEKAKAEIKKLKIKRKAKKDLRKK